MNQVNSEKKNLKENAFNLCSTCQSLKKRKGNEKVQPTNFCGDIQTEAPWKKNLHFLKSAVHLVHDMTENQRNS